MGYQSPHTKVAKPGLTPPCAFFLSNFDYIAFRGEKGNKNILQNPNFIGWRGGV